MEPLQPIPTETTIWEQNPKLKTLLLILIGVFLISGIGLAIFQQWSNNYRQKVYEETQAGLPTHKQSQSASQQVSNQPATTTPDDISDWKTYKNDEYGFEFQVPEKFNVVDNKFVYDPNKAKWPSVGVQVVEFNTVVTQDPQGKEDFLKLKQAISSQDKSQVTKLVPNHGIDVNFQNNGALLIYSETQAADYAVEYEIFDNNNNLIIIRAEDGYNADLNQSFDSIKQSDAYKNLLQIAQSFKLTN